MTIKTIEQWECDVCHVRPTRSNGQPLDGRPTSEWVTVAIKEPLNPIQFDYKHVCPSCVRAIIKAELEASSND